MTEQNNEITRLKEIIQQQKDKITYLENIINHIPCNVYWKNREGYYLGCNESNLRIVGCQSLRDFVGKTVHELLDKKYADQIYETDESIMSSGKACILEEEWINVHREPAIYLTHKIPVFDKNRQIIGLLGVSFDITDRKKMELELKQTKELAEEQSKISKIYLNNLVASLPENFYWIDKESRVLGCNENQAKLFGLTSAQLLGKNNHDIAKLFGWDDKIANAVRQNDLEVMQTKQVKKTEETIFINGQKRTFLSYKNPMLDDKNEVMGVFGIGIDITERKRMEEELLIAKEKAELANIAKTKFITNMSHDIRTPFSGILGFANLMLKTETDSSKKEMLGYIAQSSEKLLALLNKILELAKKSDQPSISTQFNLAESITNITGIMLAEIKFKNLNLEIHIDKNLPINLIGDKVKFDRILLNLLSNAIKFTKQGYIAIYINKLSQLDDEIIIQIKIADSGIGIPSDQHEMIFEKFTRLTSSYHGNYDGSGLGLYMVKQYVTDMGGTISVTSEPGKGSSFIYTLPFKFNNEKATMNCSDQNIKRSNQDKPNKHILLIEDDTITQKITRLTLEEYYGCHVHVAETGKQAFTLLAEKHYDFILMDIGLPDGDGFDLATKIRSNENYQHIPIFALTAHADEDHIQNDKSPFNAILTKPLNEKSYEQILFSTTL